MSSELIPRSSDENVEALAEFIGSRTLSVLTGAGCSTSSGIPDYRGPNGTWTRRRPMYYQEFLRSEESRRHFWARNFRGWPRFAAAEPNAAHRALADLENAGRIPELITQNVDDLHQRAGHQNLLELHGLSSRVVCLQCGERSSRLALQQRMEELNAEWAGEVKGWNPDADAEIDRQTTASFRVPSCEACGGALKPDVVFFGESVGRELVDRCMETVRRSDALLVVGSSLAIWSGYRFALAAADLQKPIAIVNFGETRADELATLKIEANCSDLLPRVNQFLGF